MRTAAALRRRHVSGEEPETAPRYELRAQQRGAGDLLLQVWQLPSAATPQLPHPRYVGALARATWRSWSTAC